MMTSSITSNDNNNTGGFEVKLPRPCRRTSSRTSRNSSLGGTDNHYEGSTVVLSHKLASRVGPETDEGFSCHQQVHNFLIGCVVSGISQIKGKNLKHQVWEELISFYVEAWRTYLSDHIFIFQDGASAAFGPEGHRKTGTVATTSGSSIGSETNSTGSKTSTTSIQSVESGVCKEIT